MIESIHPPKKSFLRSKEKLMGDILDSLELYYPARWNMDGNMMDADR